MCKISILFSPRVGGTEWITSFISKHGGCNHNYGNLQNVEFGEYKHNVISRVPFDELLDFRDNIEKGFKDDDIDFLLICNVKYKG